LKLRWSSKARADIRAIYATRSRFSTASARNVVKDIRARGRQLEEFPDSGRTVPEFENRYIRELIEGEFRIIYERFADRVVVLAVLSGRMSLDV